VIVLRKSSICYDKPSWEFFRVAVYRREANSQTYVLASQCILSRLSLAGPSGL
jgi:hypothetical protein